MNTSFKKLLLAFVVTLLGMISSKVMAQAYTVTFEGSNVYTVNDAGTITNYNFTYVPEIFASGPPLTIIAPTANMPWYGSQSQALAWATAVGGSAGYLNQDSTTNSSTGPYFAYALSSIQVGGQTRPRLDVETSVLNGGVVQIGLNPKGTGYYFAEATVASIGAPEIDGSLAPKVGFLLGCLFLMFGRKKQDSEPMMTA